MKNNKLLSKSLIAILLTIINISCLVASAHAQTPQGKIAFVRDGDIWIMNADGTEQKKLTKKETNDLYDYTEEGSLSDLNWDNNGHRIYFLASSEGYESAWQVSQKSREKEIWNNNGDVVSHFLTVRDNKPVILDEDGKAFELSPRKSVSKVLSLPYEDSLIYESLKNGAGYCMIDWSPDNQTILFVAAKIGFTGFISNMDGSGYKRINESINFYEDDGLKYLKWSPDSKYFIALTYNRQYYEGRESILLFNKKGKFLKKIYSSNETEGIKTADWSSNGKQITFDKALSNGSNNTWVINADGSSPHKIADNASSPAWQPVSPIEFKPNPDGYVFKNGIDKNKGDNWNVWKLVLGKGIKSRSTYLVLNNLKGLFQKGLCYGVATSNATFFSGYNSVKSFSFNKSATKPWGLGDLGQKEIDMDTINKEMREFIERYQLIPLIYRGNTWRGTKGVFNAISSNLDNTNRDLITLEINNKSKKVAHQITPYKIESTSINRRPVKRMYVYDSNDPGDDKRWIDFYEDDWSFDYLIFSDKDEHWRSNTSKLSAVKTSNVVKVLKRTPGGAKVVPKGSSLNKGMGYNLVLVNGQADILLAEGESKTGFEGSKFVDQIEDAKPLFPDATSNIKFTDNEVYVYKPTNKTKTVVTGNTSGKYTYVADTNKAMIKVEASTSNDSKDMPKVSEDLSKVSFSTKQKDPKKYDVSISRAINDKELRIASVNNSQIKAGETNTLSSDKKNKALTFNNQSPDNKVVVSFESRGEKGDHFESKPLAVKRGAKETYSPKDWNNLDKNKVKREIDFDSDGKIDEVQWLDNHYKRSFLSTFSIVIATLAIVALGIVLFVFRRRK